MLELPGYRIEGVAGRGGWSVVYRAVQLSLNRTVALKVIAPELANDGGFRERFRRECELAASIDHPNVLPIYDAGETGDSLFVAMRWVDGADLRTLVGGRPMQPERAVAIVLQIAMALDAAHARGLVHRDVKPGNIVVEPRATGEHAYLTDFGLAKPIDADPGLTEAGRWLGTVDFAAPEQIRGGPADERSDVYALGGVLVYALTGEVPFPRADDAAKMRAHLHEAPHPLPPPLARFEPVVRRALAKNPAERFASAGELGAAPAAGGPAPRRTGMTVALVAVALLVLAGIATGAVLLASAGDDDGGSDSAEERPKRDTKTLPTQGGTTRVEQQLLLNPLAAGSRYSGVAVVAERGGKRNLIVQARLKPTKKNEAYEVWLYNDRDDARSIGAQVTDDQGNYQGAGALPDGWEGYEYIDVSREPLDNDVSHSGESVIRGAIADLHKPE